VGLRIVCVAQEARSPASLHRALRGQSPEVHRASRPRGGTRRTGQHGGSKTHNPLLHASRSRPIARPNLLCSRPFALIRYCPGCALWCPDLAGRTQANGGGRTSLLCQGGGRGFESRRPLQQFRRSTTVFGFLTGDLETRRPVTVPHRSRLRHASVTKPLGDVRIHGFNKSPVVLLNHPCGRVPETKGDKDRVHATLKSPTWLQCGGRCGSGTPGPLPLW
jgi:hypothetical protein